jgi:DNA-binding transcriptional MerR regulator
MSTEIPGGDLVPATPYAQKKGVSPKTLDRWVEQGLLDPPVRINGRKYYRDRAEAQGSARA